MSLEEHEQNTFVVVSIKQDPNQMPTARGLKARSEDSKT